MRIPSFFGAFPRALSITALAFALALAPNACRSDKDPPPVDTATGGKAGSGGKGGTGGKKVDAAAGGSSGAVGTQDAAGDVAMTDGADANVGDAAEIVDGWSGDHPTIEVGDGGVLTVMRPFYGHPPYPAGVIRPTGAQATLDMSAATFYTKWKKDYVVTAGANCVGSFVRAPTTEGVGNGAVSQIHGAGMIATVIFAGHDGAALTTYDNMLAFARKYRSGSSALLMSHAVNRTGTGTCAVASNGDTETDGDLHIALSLLMADKQWGSAGGTNYLEEAKKMIAEIKAREMNPTTKLPYVGDYAAGDATIANKVRTSDLLAGHFSAFAAATGDPFWTEAVTAAYTLIGKIQASASPTSGLLPDFMINTGTATPAPSATAAEALYDYTTAGFPVFLAADYIANSTRNPNSKVVLDKINAWVKTKTGGNPAMVVDGYQLNGSVKAGGGVGESPLFETGFGAAAVVDAGNQAWLDSIWTRAVMDRVSLDGLTETSQLLALIVMSGNYWAP
jgi:endo-1,4-beta-D-glucanase Y